MSNLDNLVAEILQQAKKEANRILTKAKAENLEFTEKENKKIPKLVCLGIKKLVASRVSCGAFNVEFFLEVPASY